MINYRYTISIYEPGMGDEKQRISGKIGSCFIDKFVLFRQRFPFRSRCVHVFKNNTAKEECHKKDNYTQIAYPIIIIHFMGCFISMYDDTSRYRSQALAKM